MSSQSSYHANGKLLLTGEYLVLHGAKAIALPLRLGQQMEVSENEASESLDWTAFYGNEVWFKCQLNPADFSVLITTDPDKANTLTRIFRTIRQLNPGFFPKAGTQLKTVLESNPEWGFGSSSTLVSLLAQWTGVDPFELNELIFKGSGFDIACAAAEGPIFYTKGNPVRRVRLEYPFADRLYFIYSGHKKPTRADVSAFLKKEKPSSQAISVASDLSEEFAECFSQEEFNRLIVIHEKLIGDLLGKIPVKQEFFADFAGAIKSLGAWGGDFYLISSELPVSEIKNYFGNKGMKTMFHWRDLIL